VNRETSAIRKFHFLPTMPPGTFCLRDVTR
jgi:hypothetical protein